MPEFKPEAVMEEHHRKYLAASKAPTTPAAIAKSQAK